jgi:hypothetical protein
VPGAFVHGSNDVTGPSARNPLRYFQGPRSARIAASTSIRRRWTPTSGTTSAGSI